MISDLSIKTRLIGAVSLLIIATVLAVSYFTLTHFESATRELISEDQFASVSLFAGEIDGKLSDMRDLLVILSKEIPRSVVQNPGRARKYLEEHAELHRIFDNGLYLFDSSARLVAEAPQITTRVGKSFAFRKYLATTLSEGKPHISEPFFSTMPGSHPSIMFTAPIFGPDGKVIGALGGGLDLLKADIISRLISTPVGKTGYLYVITRDRRILLHPDRSRILQQDVPPGANKLLEKAILGFEGTGETVTSRGLHAITSFKRLKVKDWIVASNYPVAEANKHLYQARNALLIITAVAVLLAPLVVWYIMHLLTGPLLAFTGHVETIHEKRGEARIFPVSSTDEIGKLTSAFNRMVADLDRHQAEMEAHKEEVEKLISEIGEFNQEIETLLSERTMSLMALTIADKIRNPAALIAGVSSRLSASDDMPDSMRESFAIITEGARDIEKIVGDFQSLLKSRQSKFTYEDINGAVKEVATILTRISSSKGVRLVVNLAPRLLMVNAQINLLRVAIFHMLKNAIEATPAGGMVSVSTMEEGDNVAISIADSGTGIPKEIRNKIFDPFFTTKERSFGMGLSLVKQVVSEHMGKITVDSEEGKGTTFTIVLPERWKEE